MKYRNEALAFIELTFQQERIINNHTNDYLTWHEVITTMKEVKLSDEDNRSDNLMFKQKRDELKGKTIKIFEQFAFQTKGILSVKSKAHDCLVSLKNSKDINITGTKEVKKVRQQWECVQHLQSLMNHFKDFLLMI